MKYSILPIIIIALTLSNFSHLKAQESQPSGYYGSIHITPDFMASKHPDLIADGFFDYDLITFYIIGVDVGKYMGKNNYQLSLNWGKADIYRSIEDSDVSPTDNEVELQNSFSFALSLRRQFSRIKKTDKVVVNFGGRITTMYYHYSGVQAIRDENSDSFSPTYSYHDYGMNTIGIEGAPYIEVGKQAQGKVGFFINYELLYLRVNYQGGGLGSQRVSLIVKF